MRGVLLITFLFSVLANARSKPTPNFEIKPELVHSVKSDNSGSDTSKRHIGFIDQLEFRYGYSQETKDKSGNEEEEIELDTSYKIRFKFNNLTQKKMKSELQNLQQSKIDSIQNSLDVDFRSELFKQATQLHYDQKELKQFEKMTLIYKEKIRVLKALVRSGEGDIVELISVEKKLFNIKHQIGLKQNNINTILKLLNKQLKYSKSFKTMRRHLGFISIPSISSSIKKDILRGSSSIDASISKLEYEISKEEEGELVDFVELASRGNEIGFNIAFNIPLFESKNKSRSKYIDKIEKKYQYEKLQRKLSIELNNSKKNLLGNVEKFKTQKNSAYYKDTKRYLRIFSKTKGASPLKLLNLNILIAENEIEASELEKNIYISYIDYLSSLNVSGDEFVKRLFGKG